MKINLLNREFVYRFFVFISKNAPLVLFHIMARPVAFLSYIFFRQARRNVFKNLSHIYTDKKKIKQVTKKIFYNYCIYLGDWAKLNHMDSKSVKNFFSILEGREIINRAFSKNKGIILLTAHLGNWELGGLFFSHAGIPFNVITAQDDIQGIASVREEYRTHHNVKTITIRDDNVFFMEIVRALENNEIVAMLIDRYTGQRYVEIDFFGKPARFPIGPVHIARITGAAILPAFVVCTKQGKYHAIIDSMIDLEFTENRDKDIRVNAEKIVKVFEKYIVKYADQWYNFIYLWDY